MWYAKGSYSSVYGENDTSDTIVYMSIGEFR